MRSLLRLILLLASAAVASAQSSLVFTPPAGVTPRGKHVVLLSGDEEYRSEEAMPMLAKILSQRHGFKATVLFALDADGTINPDNQQSLPNAEALATADVIVMGLRFRNYPEAAMKQFVDAFRRGVPIIALRTSTHAFNLAATSPWASYTWNRKEPWAGGFGRQVLGETWVTHWGKHKAEATRGVIEPGATGEAVLRGVTDVFGTSDVYEAYPPADAKILLRGVVLKGMAPTDAPADYRKKRATDKQEQGVNDPAMPVAWTRVYRHEDGATNRILTTTLGAATDLTNESLRRLVVNGVYWGLGLEVPAKANVAVVDPYEPTMYGFKGYRVGLKPSDYALGKTVPAGQRRPESPAAGKKSAEKSAAAAPATPASATRGFQFNPGDRVAIIGNGLADRMQHHGWLEAMIQTQNPAHQIVVRNLSFAGDEVATRARSKDFGTPDEWLTKVQANVVFAFFGYNESFAGQEGLAKFKEDLGKFLRETRAQKYNGLNPPRIVLFSPTATEKHPDPNLPYSPSINANLAAYAQAMAEVARDQEGVTYVDLFQPSKDLFAETVKGGQPLTIDGVHFNDSGERRLVEKVYPAMFGAAAPAMDSAQARQVRELVNAKSEMWHSRYRSVDGYNIYGDRSKIAYVSHPDQPKITNTQVMMEEMAQRDVMTTNLERRIWAAASGSKTPADMLPLPVVNAFGTNKPGPNIDGTYPFLDGDEAIAQMKLAPGLKVNLFASEKQFPELAKAVQMAWDTKGRLWVAVWPNYPERTPTSKRGDSILILEDTDGDGRADKCTTFVSNLNCPTGFQFFKDGILLMQAPDLWWVRDTDGDGKADTKERVLMGLDSADSHHTTNSMIYEPGGAVLMSDGVFHRTQVETVAGAVRNTDGAIYRYEPLTQRFETYAAYNFANPHGRTFDYWGNDLITDATGNHTYFGPAFSGKIDFPAKHPKLKTIWDRPSRPSAGSIILTSTHFPEEYWGNFLNPNVIGFQGVFRVKLSDDGAGIKGERLPDIIQSTDKNFRPIDLCVGPDGALYLADWHNPLIGHLQSHLRDSNRDHEHGRIYRITAEGRPLARAPKIDGEPIPALLELLKRPENHIRNLAKIELGKHDAAPVIAALKAWVAALDPKGPDYAHHLTEALWVHQWHNVVDHELLRRVANLPESGARAAAARVISYWRERVPDAIPQLKQLANDESPRVRLQAVRAASYFATLEATDVALTATKKPVDYYLDYTIGETLRQLRPLWRKSLGGEGQAIAGGDPASIRYLLRTLTVAELLKLPRTPDVAENILSRSGVTDAVRAEALAKLAEQRGTTPMKLLLNVIDAPGEVDVKGVGRLLLAQPPESLRAERAALLKLGLTDNAEGRTYAWAAMAVADGTLDRSWSEAAGSPLSQASILGGFTLLPNAALRAAAYDRVMPILALPITDLQGPDHIVAAIQRDAIKTAAAARREPAAVFVALTRMIERGYQVPAAAQGIRLLPRTVWQGETALAAAKALIAWAAKTHASERTSRDYVETIQVADDLTGVLTATDAEPLRKTLAGLRVPVFVVRTVVEEMRYDTPRLVVPLGKPFEIIFENPDVMPHNLVIVKPGTREKVGTAAANLTPEERDDKGRAYIPAFIGEPTPIVAATKILETGQNETLRIPAIREAGTYEFVCTFPGHWLIMYGQLVVTKDVDAYLKQNPVAAKSTPADKPATAGKPAAGNSAPSHNQHGH